jgi:hypothetical protein
MMFFLVRDNADGTRTPLAMPNLPNHPRLKASSGLFDCPIIAMRVG